MGCFGKGHRKEVICWNLRELQRQLLGVHERSSLQVQASKKIPSDSELSTSNSWYMVVGWKDYKRMVFSPTNRYLSFAVPSRTLDKINHHEGLYLTKVLRWPNKTQKAGQKQGVGGFELPKKHIILSPPPKKKKSDPRLNLPTHPNPPTIQNPPYPFKSITSHRPLKGCPSWVSHGKCRKMVRRA